MFGDENLIKNMLLMNAQNKSANELENLSQKYFLGLGVDKDYALAFQLTKMAADKNNKQSQLNLAYFYLHGYGVKPNVDKAIEIYEKLAKSKNKSAINQLERIYGSDEYKRKDILKAVEYHKLGASLGAQNSLYNLAVSYMKGWGVEQNYAEAKKYFEIAAKKGMKEAWCELGGIYEYGFGVDKDLTKAFACYKKAADLGHFPALCNVGNFYFEGRGVEKDYQKAYECVKKAADENVPVAIYSLGYMYYTGKGVEKDIDKARDLFFKAAEMEDGQANYMLGYLYHLGIGVEQNDKTAIAYYEKAAALGEENAIADIGTMYYKGQGVEKDLEKAIEFFKKASEMGSGLAQCNLAVAYINGEGVEKDLDKAMQILNNVDDEFCDKYYYLGAIAFECIAGEEKTKETVEKAIENFNKYLEFSQNYANTRYAPIVNLKLAQAYLDLYYFDQINTNNRSRQHFSIPNENREKAKEYLKIAQNMEHNFSASNLEIFKKNQKFVEDLLNDEQADISKYTYKDFKKQFYGQHENLFLMTKKQEFELFDDGVKFYFDKRDRAQEIAEAKSSLTNEQFEKRKPVIIKKLEELKIANIEEKITAMKNAEIQKVQSVDVDFSNSVINIDKFLEEILHYLFVDCLYDYKLDVYKKIITDTQEDVKNKAKEMSVDFLKEMNLILNGIDKSLPLSQEVLAKKVEIFTSKFNKNFEMKSLAAEQIEKLENYYNDNKDSLTDQEKGIIKKIFDIAEARKLLSETTKSEKFELGSLFYLAYTDADTSQNILPQKVIDPMMIGFALEVGNDKLSASEGLQKLNELLIKVEKFRVVVRNVASHKSILTQSAVELGFNICIVQDNSIFKLLDELFGEFLNKKYIEQLTNNIEI